VQPFIAAPFRCRWLTFSSSELTAERVITRCITRPRLEHPPPTSKLEARTRGSGVQGDSRSSAGGGKPDRSGPGSRIGRCR